jgi:hypothetical protein
VAVRTWQEPSPGTVGVLVRFSALGACVLVAAVSAVVANWDALVVSVVLGAALGVDLYRDLRTRELVVIGPDVVVVVTRRSRTSVPRGAVLGVQSRGRRSRRPVLLRRSGPPVDLPPGVPTDLLSDWLEEPGSKRTDPSAVKGADEH